MVATAIPEGLAVWWWWALGGALAVAVVVVLLLAWLYRVVRLIEGTLSDVWTRGKDVARNTATAWILGRTAQIVEELRDEAAEHHRVLSGEGG